MGESFWVLFFVAVRRASPVWELVLFYVCDWIFCPRDAGYFRHPWESYVNNFSSHKTLDKTRRFDVFTQSRQVYFVLATCANHQAQIAQFA